MPPPTRVPSDRGPRFRLFSSALCEDLLGQYLATVAAHQLGQFPKNSSHNLAHERMGHGVCIMIYEILKIQ